MSHRMRAIFFPSLLGFVLGISILAPNVRDPVLAFIEFCVQTFVIFMITHDLVLQKHAGQKLNRFEVFFLGATLAVFGADTLYNLRIVAPGIYSKAYDVILEALYPAFTILLSIASYKKIRTVRPHTWQWLKIAIPAFLIYEFIVFKFLTLPMYQTLDRTLVLKIFSAIYNLGMGFLFAISIPFSLRSISRQSYYYFQLILLLLASDLAIRFQTSFVTKGAFSWAEVGWCSTFIGMAWLASSRRDVKGLFCGELQLAPLMSFRTLLSLSVCGANLLFLFGIMIFKVFSMETAIDVSSALLLLYVFWLGANEISIRMANDLDRATTKLFRSNKHLSTDGLINLRIEEVRSKAKIHELNQILDSYNELVQQTNKMIESNALANRNATIAEIASQVAHDVRSPLSALNMVLSTLDPLPENKRMIIRNATQRITDIANSLALKGRASYDDSMAQQQTDLTQMALQKTMLVSVVEALVSEKRLQFKDRSEIQIEGFFGLAYGLFSEVNRAELCRVLSNLVNNSVEAMTAGRPGGHVSLAIASDKQQIYIIIKDNGKGIPPDLMARIGERGFSYGKLSGSGLGLHHANTVIQSFRGDLKIESKLGEGTQVTIKLPKCSPPDWYVESLDLTQHRIIVSIDDDITIHQIWKDRLANIGLPMNHLMFSNLNQFADYLKSPIDKSGHLFLVDYEFHGESMNGISMIQKYGLQKSAILVSSRFDEPKIRHQVEELRLRMIPKSLAAIIPMMGFHRAPAARPMMGIQ